MIDRYYWYLDKKDKKIRFDDMSLMFDLAVTASSYLLA